jgi:ribosomal-protein-alanine N-acetyltransferase
MALADLEEVVAVENLCYSHPWSAELFRRELDNPLSTVDLLWVDGKLAGYLCSWLVCGELHILNVATAPAFRRRGVAAALLRHLFARSRGQGLERAFLEVRASNAGAIALYRAFGFHPVSRRQRYYPDGEDALIMELGPVTGDRLQMTNHSTV